MNTSERKGRQTNAGFSATKAPAGNCTFVLALLLFAASAARGAEGESNPRLATMHIDIWPEFDRRAALVILKAELPKEITLPAAVSLSIPAASGGPSAVAYATHADAQLFNLPHNRVRSGEFITLQLHAPERHVHVEFYEPLATDAADRAYTYVWPGDVAVDRLSVSLQEPVAATNVSVQPDLRPAGADPNGLRYRMAELGRVEAGKQVPIRIRYTKTDPRITAEVLQKTASGTASGIMRGLPAWDVIVPFAVALAAAAAAAWLWLRRGRQPPARASCPRCRAALAAGSHFCSNCGSPCSR